MDQLSDRPPALHRRRQVFLDLVLARLFLDLLLARPQSSLPPLPATGPLAPSRRPPHRDRPRPHLHLLGLTQGRKPTVPRHDPGGSDYRRADSSERRNTMVLDVEGPGPPETTSPVPSGGHLGPLLV